MHNKKLRDADEERQRKQERHTKKHQDNKERLKKLFARRLKRRKKS